MIKREVCILHLFALVSNSSDFINLDCCIKNYTSTTMHKFINYIPFIYTLVKVFKSYWIQNILYPSKKY
jgi:hypothetical protein